MTYRGTTQGQNNRKQSSQQIQVSGNTEEDIGLTRERVQPATLEAIEKLFPPPMNGIEFLGLVLRYATIKQLTLPAFAQEKSWAVITIKNIRALSKLIGWSYDTTHKYVALFCALGLFVKGRRQRQVELYFPLDTYAPPESLAALDTLIAEYRPKVRQSAQQVKMRFLLYFGSSQSFFDTMGVPGELQPILQEIRQLFQQEGVDSKKQQTLLLQIARVVQRVLPGENSATGDYSPQKSLPPSVQPFRQQEDQLPNGGTFTSAERSQKSRPARPERVGSSSYIIPSSAKSTQMATVQKRCHPSTTESQKVDFQSQGVDSLLSPTQKAVDSKQERVDSFHLSASHTVDSFASEVDSLKGSFGSQPKSLPSRVDFSSPQGRNSDFLTGRDDFSTREGAKKVTAQKEESDFSQQKSPLTGDFQQERVDFSKKVAPLSDGEVDLNNLSNVNVNKIITNNLNNVNVKSLQTLAAFLGTVLGEDRPKWGIYVDHLKQYSQPEAIIAALIKTLCCKRDGSLHTPPAFFLARSKEYHVAIPADVRQLVGQYASLSYGQLVEALKRPAFPEGDAHQASQQTREIKSSALQALKAPPLYIQLQPERAHMSWQEATELYKQLCNDPRMILCKKFILPVDVERTRFALLLDVSIASKVRQTFLYSQQEWSERSQGMRTCLSLFESPESLQRSKNRFSSLREVLKKA